ncbi:9097_t:CDS:2 [Entrophospora sp. SA101]|nr:9097_t:CDS:2 [Entrophospora sp. SA101]
MFWVATTGAINTITMFDDNLFFVKNFIFLDKDKLLELGFLEQTDEIFVFKLQMVLY